MGSGGVSSTLRATGSLRIDDLGSPRGKGRVRIGIAAGSAAIPVRESGDREAEQLARDGPATAVSGVAVERFFGRPKAGLSHVKGDKPAYPLWVQRGWRGTPSLRTRTAPRYGGLRGRGRRPPSPVTSRVARVTGATRPTRRPTNTRRCVLGRVQLSDLRLIRVHRAADLPPERV